LRGGTNWGGASTCSRRGFDVPALRAELDRLTETQSRPEFWAARETAGEVVRRVGELRRWLDPLVGAAGRLEELGVMAELARDEADEALAEETAGGLEELAGRLDRLEFQFLLHGPDDSRGALLEIHPGAGGTESQDWAEMLLRMYTRYFERQGMKFEAIDLQAGEEAGIKSAALEIDAEFAFGYLKSESGVHRLVRISPYDAQARRHTSFASVFVYPLVEGDIEVEINEADLRIDTFRASGAGGQHVNKTSSAIRIVHLPTNITVQCQSERSQHRNRDSAMKMLRARLYMRALDEEKKKRDVIENEKKDIAWGSQIRSYVLQPYTKIKDHRTDWETSNTTAFLDGEIEACIDAYLRATSQATGR
jgi:peptide chain release factor 2